MTQTWFIAGAGRELGVEIAKAVKRAADRVVATARSQKAISAVLGRDNEQLLSVWQTKRRLPCDF
jgi:NAD(P)-dependent dehydrogenase (short-subunit alcohol dehydrogenase family)